MTTKTVSAEAGLREALALLDRCRSVLEQEWAEGIVDNARRREAWALINEIGPFLRAALAAAQPSGADGKEGAGE